MTRAAGQGAALPVWALIHIRKLEESVASWERTQIRCYINKGRLLSNCFGALHINATVNVFSFLFTST